MRINRGGVLLAISVATLVIACQEKPTAPGTRVAEMPRATFSKGNRAEPVGDTLDSSTPTEECNPLLQLCDGDPSQGGGLPLSEPQAVDTADFNHLQPGGAAGIDLVAFFNNPWSVSDAYFSQNAPAYSQAQIDQIDGDVAEISSWTAQFGEPTAMTEPAQAAVVLASFAAPSRRLAVTRGAAARGARARARLARGDECDYRIPTKAAAALLAASHTPASNPLALTTAQNGSSPPSCEKLFNQCIRRCFYMPGPPQKLCRLACMAAFAACKGRRRG